MFISTRPFGEVQSKSMRAYTQSGQYRTIVESRVYLTVDIALHQFKIYLCTEARVKNKSSMRMTWNRAEQMSCIYLGVLTSSTYPRGQASSMLLNTSKDSIHLPSWEKTDQVGEEYPWSLPSERISGQIGFLEILKILMTNVLILLVQVGW